MRNEGGKNRIGNKKNIFFSKADSKLIKEQKLFVFPKADKFSLYSVKLIPFEILQFVFHKFFDFKPLLLFC